MPTCDNCDSHVSERFAAVFAVDWNVEACFDCRTKQDCRTGAVSDPERTAHADNAAKYIPKQHQTHAYEREVSR